jgi:hypothetical protein
MGTFADRRTAILTRHAMLETVPESPWHPQHPNSPRAKGQPDLSQRPIAFVGNKYAFFVGDCAVRCLAALKAYHEREFPRLDDDTQDAQRREIEIAGEAALSALADGTKMLRFDRAEWNDATSALGAMGIVVCTTGEKE